MRRRTMAVLVACVSAITAAAAPAAAQTAADRIAAEALFEEGKKLLGDGKLAEACSRFESSQALDPGVGTLLFLAECYEAVGRTASAWSTFREAAAGAKTIGQADRERIARDRAARLQDSLYKITIVASSSAGATPGLVVKRGDLQVKKEVLGVAVPVDPGTVEISASAPGKKTWSTTVDVPAGKGSRTVQIPALVDSPAPPPEPVAIKPLPAEKEAPAAPPPSSGWSGGRIAGVTIGALGLVGVGVGAVFGGIAASQAGQVDSRCPKIKCSDADAVNLSKQAGTNADVSTAAFVGGGAALLGGILLFAASPSSSEGQRGFSWFSPVVGKDLIGIHGGATW